ncbi:MAG: hypothetical protein NT062_29840 [Proteobacteria bacterium]|nr:hypothetical protein [Pseudomonadota bacterium]
MFASSRRPTAISRSTPPPACSGWTCTTASPASRWRSRRFASGAATEKPPITASESAEPAPSDDEERRRILEVLTACGGNQSRAAKKLGLSRGALIRRLVTYGITRPQERD